MKSKKFSITFMSVLIIMLVLSSSIVYYTDPYFHFHAPRENLNYVLQNQRYQNNGITRHFDYDAIITGTSMSENFKTSELDELFNTKSIKTSYAGGSLKEINQGLERAISYNPNIKMIVRAIDNDAISLSSDVMWYNNLPTYLYDDNKFNDINYLLNKELYTNDLLHLVIQPTIKKESKMNFDDYSSWYSDPNIGKKQILEKYERPELLDEETLLGVSKRYEFVKDNIQKNVIDIAIANPDIDFYYYFPPMSILRFDQDNEKGVLLYQFYYLEYASELMLAHDNIKLFSFFDNFDIITNLDNYVDTVHHKDYVNTLILENMKNDIGKLTFENYHDHFDKVKEYYLNYDYDNIFND